MVEGEELDAGVEGFRGDVGFSEAAWKLLVLRLRLPLRWMDGEHVAHTWDDIGKRAQCALNLPDCARVLGDEVAIHAQPFRRKLHNDLGLLRCLLEAIHDVVAIVERGEVRRVCSSALHVIGIEAR